MIFFGHIAISTGTGLILEKGVIKFREIRNQKLSSNERLYKTLNHKHIDYRLVMDGSMLPDIIDKPVGTYFLNGVFSNGRIFSHGILFFVVLAVPAAIMYWKRKSIWLAILAFGSLMHIVLDEMWRTPSTLFWPLLGPFEKVPTAHWVMNIVDSIPTTPSYWVPELFGIIILTVLFMRLLRARKFTEFLKTGTLV
jgi:inner membrane protein